MTKPAPDETDPFSSERPAGTRLSEYWTATGRGVILTGEAECITALVEALNLPPGAPVKVTESVWALALWEEAAERYAREFRPAHEDGDR